MTNSHFKRLDFDIAVKFLVGWGERWWGRKGTPGQSVPNQPSLTSAIACPSAFAPVEGLFRACAVGAQTSPCRGPASQHETLAQRPRALSRDSRQAGPHTSSWKFMALLPALLCASPRDGSNHKIRHYNNSYHLLITHGKPGSA